MMQKNIFLLRLLLLGLFLPLLAFPTGCWDRREPSLLGVVTVAAFDYNPQTGMLQVIAQVANPLGISTGENSGPGGGENPFWVVKADGHTVYEAIKNIEKVSTRKLIWSHLEAVLFSETMATEGLRPVLDYIDRERQARLIARPFVVRGDVRQLLESKFPLEELGGQALIRQLLTIRMEDAFMPEIDSLLRLFHHLTVPGVELILPRIEMQVEEGEDNGAKNGGNSKMKTGRPNPVKISGAALFRGDRLSGYFDEKEIAGYLWITENIRRQTMVFTCPGEADKYLTVEVYCSSSNLKAEVQGDNVRMHLFVRAEGKLQDFAGLKLPLDEDFRKSLNRRMATVIHNQIDTALLKARELNLDIFGFGYELYKNRPQDWKRLEEKWPEIFSKVEVEPNVHAIVRCYGLVVDPIRIR